MKAFVVAMSLLVLATPAAAQDRPRGGLDHGGERTPSDTAHSGDVNEQGERLICRRISDSSTSRMASRRVCRTAEQWRQASRNSD